MTKYITARMAGFNAILCIVAQASYGQDIFERALRLSEERAAVGSKLIGVVRDSTSMKDREQAIRILGEIRERAAVRILLDHLDLESQGSYGFGPLQKFPAATAITQIGHPLIPAVTGLFLMEQSDRRLHILAYVLRAMDGQIVSAVRVEEAMREKSQTEVQHDNFQRLLKIIESENFKNPVNWPK